MSRRGTTTARPLAVSGTCASPYIAPSVRPIEAILSGSCSAAVRLGVGSFNPVSSRPIRNRSRLAGRTRSTGRLALGRRPGRPPSPRRSARSRRSSPGATAASPRIPTDSPPDCAQSCARADRRRVGRPRRSGRELRLTQYSVENEAEDPRESVVGRLVHVRPRPDQGDGWVPSLTARIRIATGMPRALRSCRPDRRPARPPATPSTVDFWPQSWPREPVVRSCQPCPIRH